MGILDLSLVTTSLLNLLEYAFSVASENKVSDITFSSQRPDQLKGNVVGLYLFHVSEDPNYKNLPAPEDATAHIKHSSMGLQLYYQLVAQYLSDPESEDTAILEQNMMGIAMKTLHDSPIIDDKTKTSFKTDTNDIEERFVFPENLKETGTRLKIELLPVDFKDAISYWASSQSSPRLAAYYQVSVAILKREMPPTRTGRVLGYGVYSFPGTGPRIDGCRNTISFRIPGRTEMNEVELSPAQVPVGDKLLFTGTGFSGWKTDLLIKNSNWEKSLAVDSAWKLSVSGKGATIEIQGTIANGILVNIVPGMYSATVKVTKQIILPNGSYRYIEHLSNECPFVITPRVDNVTDNIIELPSIPDKTITVQGFAFPLEMSAEPLYPSLKIYVGSRKLTGIKVADTLESGEFKVEDKNTIKLLIPADLEPGNIYFPLRIFVNGAESTPNWIKVP